MTVTGVGFHGFAVLGVPAAAGLARCRFGGAAGAEAEATPINDTALLCAVPPWAAPPAEVPIEV